MKVITIATQKGGAGKTTTAAALAQAAAYRGLKSVLIDTDAQASATLIYGADTEEAGVYEILTGRRGNIQHTDAGDIIAPGTDIRAGASPDSLEGSRKLLQKALQQLAPFYDVCMIDTAPGRSAMLLQALCAADTVIIPAVADSLGLAGLRQISDSIKAARKDNRRLSVAGVVFIKHSERTVLKRQYAELIRQQCAALGLPVADTVIREAVAIQEAQAMRTSLYSYAPRSNPARDYLKLIEELNLF